MGNNLKVWQRTKWEVTNSRIYSCEEELGKIQGRSDQVISGRERVIKEELKGLVKIKERVWKQKSREIWLMDGDANTKFFHTATLVRRKRNYIRGIRDDAGEWLESR